MKILESNSLQELKEIVANYNEPAFRATQIYEGIIQGKNLSQITNIPKSLKEKLEQDFVSQPFEIYTIKKSQKDETQKFLYKLYDGNLIEGVLMKYEYGYTLCVSTQVGCRMGCKFCASGLNGLVRNLEAGEILLQVLTINAYLGGTKKNRKITNIVLMGSGEPFDNYDNVIKFLRLVSAPEGINISCRNISLSTCGLVDKMNKFADENLPITLTISLHASNDEQRKLTMPIANAYSIKEIVKSAKNYFNKTGRRIIFEYALIKDINDSKKCASELAEVLKGLTCHINVIPLNSVKERNLLSTTRKYAYQFVGMLEEKGLSATVRRTMGEDIDGACGQLRNKTINS